MSKNFLCFRTHCIEGQSFVRSGYFRSLCLPSWSTADGTDDPLEAAKDSIFVKILLKLMQEGEKYYLSFIWYIKTQKESSNAN